MLIDGLVSILKNKNGQKEDSNVDILNLSSQESDSGMSSRESDCEMNEYV